MSTYHRNVQLGASRCRRNDARRLLAASRWTGATYLGGYAIECSLKAWICYLERKADFQETKAFSSLSGVKGHNLALYLQEIKSLKIAISSQEELMTAWRTVTSFWSTNDLRYSPSEGSGQNANSFINAVDILYRFIMSQQNEAI